MPVPKRSSKIVSYNEQQDDDDDDFISIVDNSKKTRINKSNESLKTVKKHDEKDINLSPIMKLTSSEESEKPAIIELNDNESTSSQSTVSNDDEQISPKTKRLKHDEDDINENDEDKSIPIVSLTRLSDPPKRNSSLPLGFPTSKINIPSPHVSRVGLSRKSLPIKPLHPNLTSRTVHE